MNNKGGKIFIFVLLIAVSGFFYAQKIKAQTPGVIISEICWMGDEESSSHEWIELKNNTDEDIDLEGWVLVALDGSPNIALVGNLPALGYFLLERTSDESASEVLADLIYSGALANDGETLELRDEDDNLIDSIEAEEGWMAGDNETKQTMERDSSGWQTSLSPGGTPRAKNSEAEEEEEEPEEEEISIPSGGGGSVIAPKKLAKPDIIINEIYPNPFANDRQFEFIELYNRSKEMFDLTGWRIENDKGKVYEFGKFDNLFDIEINNRIPAQGFLVIFRSISGIALDNNGGEIKLFSPDRKVAKQVLKYREAYEGLSYINTQTINLEKITTSTRDFLLNSTRVGDWVWTRLPTPGKTNQVESVNSPPKASFSFPREIVAGQPASFDSSDTIDEDGDRLSFFWDFGDGVKLGVAEPTHTFLESGQYRVRLEVGDGQESSILEKNIRVLNPFADLEEINSSSVIGQNFFEQELAWINQARDNNYFESFDLPIDFVGEQKVVEVPLIEVRSLPLKTTIKTQGIVIVEPGIFGTQYFYIASSPALKIYNYKKDFPEVIVGDLVEVSGELAELRGELCLKTKEMGDIEILDNIEPLEPEKINSKDLKEENLGKLVELEGEILEKKSLRIYLGDSFGEAEIYIKSGTKIDTKRIAKGDKIQVIGLLNKVSERLVVMPRSDNDIVLLESEDDEGKIAGAEGAGVEEWELPQRDKKNELLKYLLIIALAIIFVSGVLIFKNFKNKQKSDSN